MSTWKKIIVSGSGAHLSSVTASNGSIISGSLTMSGSITNVDNIDFNMTSSALNAAGRMVWDDGNGSLDLGLKGGNVNLLLGQQTYARVYNLEATTLNKGQVVYISGSQGNRVAAKLADYSGEQGSSTTIGFVAESIASGGEGFVITNGVLEKLNTIGLTEGKLLYLSSSGQYSEIKPIAPQHTVTLGYVERVHATVGSIYVKIDNGYELDELHNVLATSATHGDLLMYSASLWKNSKQLSGSYGLTGSLQATSFTGSLQGSASYSIQSLSSSFAQNSSTASYVINAVSSSFATTASYVLGGGATVTNPGNNYVITSDGTSGGLVGETNLSFDGSILNVTGSVIATRYTGSLQYFDYNSNGNTSFGIGIGDGAIANTSYGIGIGYNSSGNDWGIGIGYNARDNDSWGIGIGYDSRTNDTYAIGIGREASSNYSYGVGIGYISRNNYNGGVGIGMYATSNGNGFGTVAIGSYSKAERKNEIVSTAGGIDNKSQTTIQKFNGQSISSGPSYTEILVSGLSSRLTIFPSSVYHFRFQINAIEYITFVCKTWEVVGAIKRDASNNTTMIGSPIYTITSEDSAAVNWDIIVDADDTNDSLRLRGKHDATYGVVFSATVWATETRL